MNENVIDNLRAFNRKERFFLIGMVLGNPKFEMSDQFKRQVNDCLGIDIPAGAFAAMDYHIDWIYASLFISSSDGKDRPYSNEEEIIKATQEDIDFLIAYQDGDEIHIVMIEAKGVTGFSNSQLKSKRERFKDIFGNTGDSFPGVIPHFAIVSPRKPSRLSTDDWPSWMIGDMGVPWIKLTTIPTGLEKVSRCNQEGKTEAQGQYWTVVPELKSSLGG